MIAEVSDNPEEPVVTENVTRDMEKYLKAANRFSR
jgi:hypothetical protein